MVLSKATQRDESFSFMKPGKTTSSQGDESSSCRNDTGSMLTENMRYSVFSCGFHSDFSDRVRISLGLLFVHSHKELLERLPLAR